ncbi:MAG: hypothetical protein Tsb0032_25900 [Kiloniellaceae bacterium]
MPSGTIIQASSMSTAGDIMIRAVVWVCLVAMASVPLNGLPSCGVGRGRQEVQAKKGADRPRSGEQADGPRGGHAT